MNVFAPEMLAMLWPAIGVTVLLQFITTSIEWGYTMMTRRILATPLLWPLFLLEMLHDFSDKLSGGRGFVWAVYSVAAFVYLGSVIILAYHPSL